MSFKVGDKVRVVNDFSNWFWNCKESEDQREDTVFTVVDNKSNKSGREWTNHETKTIEIEGVNKFPDDFELVFSESTPPVFQIGDEIVCINSHNNWYKVGEKHIVRGVPFVTRLRTEERDALVVHVEKYQENNVYVCCEQFELVPKKEPVNVNIVIDRNSPVDPKYAEFAEEISKIVDERYCNLLNKDPSQSLGVHRPVLETRKVDKIRMELFDDGFPNAVLEIAKVMTWAQKAKGYKDHDWQNLPDPENSLKGAGSRHRRDANSQKMKGVAAKDRVDHESNLHHLAHQAFNVLAELELILTGRIA